ncbi:DUF1289 domain-containing protein [Methylomonas sp. HYX-M1]|uniref:DUF1289 domain-containing protein n=1 Tax=Methylomonas sp. HYX-M1 TaxID=3139307 RepID=UPI00345BABA0
MNDNTVPSPCVRNCCLNEEDVCLGCFRTCAEICSWSQASGEQRREILRKAAQRRKLDALKRGIPGNRH